MKLKHQVSSVYSGRKGEKIWKKVGDDKWNVNNDANQAKFKCSRD